MESPLTCSAYHGRGKYYFNKSPNIEDEALNEYLNKNKSRMNSTIGKAYAIIRQSGKLNLSELFPNRKMSELSNKFSLNKTTLIDKSDVERIIKLFKIALDKEESSNELAVHPIIEMYTLMNELDEVYTDEELPINEKSSIEQSVESDIENEIEEIHTVEGEVRHYYSKRYERNARTRLLAIEKHGLNCFACGFNFEKVYGELGKDFIEVHHIIPLSTINEPVEVNPETDLVPLCANCHRMAHRRKDNVLSVVELKELIEKNKN